MPIRELAAYFPDAPAEEIMLRADTLTEIRMRIGKKIQLVSTNGDAFVGQAVEPPVFRKLLLRMMDYSYYTREEELANGFFTLRNGCRVGVSGSFVHSEGRFVISHINSVCIRVARALPGCASQVVGFISDGGYLRSTLILSLPGFGKTSMLRDIARQLSQRGYSTCIADERHEIAACRDGIPTLDVGPRTDVIDGLPKTMAIKLMLRSLSPQVIITDEIGNERDAQILREAVSKGISVIASAHASGIDAFERSKLGGLTAAGLFSIAVLLADSPGSIREIRRYER